MNTNDVAIIFMCTVGLASAVILDILAFGVVKNLIALNDPYNIVIIAIMCIWGIVFNSLVILAPVVYCHAVYKYNRGFDWV